MPILGMEFHKMSTNEWVSASERDPADEDGLRLIALDGVAREVMYSDIPGNSWNQNRLNKFVERANELLTLRQPLSGLPDDDPDKTTDPDQFPRLYWDNGDLCSRVVTVSDATWDGEQLSFTLTRVSL